MGNARADITYTRRILCIKPCSTAYRKYHSSSYASRRPWLTLACPIYTMYTITTTTTKANCSRGKQALNLCTLHIVFTLCLCVCVFVCKSQTINYKIMCTNETFVHCHTHTLAHTMSDLSTVIQQLVDDTKQLAGTAKQMCQSHNRQSLQVKRKSQADMESNRET